MLIISFEGREAKGLSKGRYDETFAGEDEGSNVSLVTHWGTSLSNGFVLIFTFSLIFRIYK